MARIANWSTSEGFDVLCEIVHYVYNILEDGELTDELRGQSNLSPDSTQAEIYAAGLKKISKLIPILLKTHRDDVYGIIAAVNDKSIDDIKKQSFLQTCGEIRDIVSDKDLQRFFSPARRTEEA